MENRRVFLVVKGISKLQECLNSLNYRTVAQADSFKDCVKMIPSNPCDLVITDDDNEIAEKYAYQIHEQFGLPTIFVSNKPSKRLDVTEPFVFLSFPFEESDLQRSMELALYKGQMERKLRESEDQLRQSQRLESIGRFAGGIAHEFNSLLTVIIGYAKYGQQQVGEKSPVLETLIEIHETARTAALLTKQILAFSSNQIFSIRQVDIGEVLSKVTGFMKPLMGETIEINFVKHPEPVFLHVDDSQIEQVFFNLLTNARDAMIKGGRIDLYYKIATINEDNSRNRRIVGPTVSYIPSGKYVCVTFADQGVGIAPEVQKKMFEPFFTTKGHGVASGLGLSVAYGIVRQHKGFIDVVSLPGQGATFEVYLPLPESDVKLPDEPLGQFGTQGKETILIAEDTDLLKKMLKTILSDMGYTILLASNGEEAITMYEQHQNDIRLILLDMVMPKKGGRQVYEEIVEKSNRVKFLFTSGYTSDDDIVEFAQNEGVQIIPKPYDPDELARKIRSILDN
ncbi:response regulator [bacterium]|nr:response regulator [bacterium]